MTSRGDVGDFYIVVRQVGRSKSIIERDVVYKDRSFTISGLPESSTKYELCVLARDSIGNVKHFRSSQCQVLQKTGNGASGLLRPAGFLPIVMIGLHFVV